MLPNQLLPMSAPVFVRPLTDQEGQALHEATASEVNFTRRRAQILLFSNQGLMAPQIAEGLGCVRQTVLTAIHDFNERALESLAEPAKAPTGPEPIFDEDKRKALMEIAHQSPRSFEQERSMWSLEALAEVAFDEGLTDEQVSHETIRQAILAMGVSWQRAKDWIESPDPQYALKKNSEIG